MAPREVNVLSSNWSLTGSTVNIQQRSVDFVIQWIDNSGNSHQVTETALFPNILSVFTNAELREIIEPILLRALRVKHGVDT